MSSTVNIVNLEKFKDTCLFSVTLKKWANRGRVKDMAALAEYIRQLETEPGDNNTPPQIILASDRVKSTKVLIKSARYDALCKRMGEIKKYVLERSMPSYFRTGMFVVKSSEVAGHEQAMRDMVKNLKAPNGELELFLAGYELDVNNAESAPVKKGGLGPLFDASDYPTTEELRAAFDIEWYWLALSVPDNIPDALKAEAGEKFTRRLMDAAEDIENALREEFRELLNHAQERLTPGEDGAPKVFRNTLIGNLKNFIETFDSKNVFGDDKLAALVAEARKLMLDDKGNVKFDAQRLRENKDTRSVAREAFAKMQATIDGMIGEKRRRAITLED